MLLLDSDDGRFGGQGRRVLVQVYSGGGAADGEKGAPAAAAGTTLVTLPPHTACVVLLPARE